MGESIKFSWYHPPQSEELHLISWILLKLVFDITISFGENHIKYNVIPLYKDTYTF